MTPRRYYLLKAQARARDGEEGLALAWTAKQRECPGTPLPEHLVTPCVAAAGYTTVEDIDGVGLDDDAAANRLEELIEQDIPQPEAEALLAYVATLPAP